MYSSTRCKKNITASKAIIEGISDDGGLYIIKEIKLVSFIILLRIEQEKRPSLRWPLIWFNE